jgi:hypothetical protein
VTRDKVRMMKKILIGTALLLSMTLPAAASDLMDGFRGYPWGSDVKAIRSSDPKLVEGHMGVMPGVEAYQRTGEELNFGGIKAEAITYIFYKGKFTTVSIDFRGFDNYEKLLAYCKKEFGPAAGSATMRAELYADFESPRLGAMLLYQLSMQTSNYGKLFLYSKQ